MEALWIKTLQPDCTIDSSKLTLKAIRKTGLKIRMNSQKGAAQVHRWPRLSTPKKLLSSA